LIYHGFDLSRKTGEKVTIEPIVFVKLNFGAHKVGHGRIEARGYLEVLVQVTVSNRELERAGYGSHRKRIRLRDFNLKSAVLFLLICPHHHNDSNSTFTT
jgi:hypothetical protein